MPDLIIPDIRELTPDSPAQSQAETVAAPPVQPADRQAVELPVPPAAETADHPRPFGLLLQQRRASGDSHFEPTAAILLTPALRTSGLLFSVPAEELKTLMWLFSFLSANGDMLPTLPQLTEAMRASEAKVRARLEKLASCTWQGKPLVQELPRENGLHAWVPAATLFFVQETLPKEPDAQILSYTPAGREAVIAHSRETYARPRAEVEAMIAKQMGWEEPGEPATPEEAVLQDTRQRLRLLGLSKEEVDTLVERYPIERIQKQVYYLPYRHAKSPARFLLAAIENDYEPPLALRPKPADEQTAELVHEQA